MARQPAFVVLLLAVLFATPPLAVDALAQAGGDPSGVWLTQAGDARVRVSRCGGGICGVVVWLKEPIDPGTGKPQIDDKNPNPRLAQRPIIGLALFSGMRPDGPGKWSGRIYNADNGKTYDSHISVAAPDQLRVEAAWVRSAAEKPGAAPAAEALHSAMAFKAVAAEA